MWELYDRTIRVTNAEAKVWLIDASGSADRLPILHATLSRDEKNRADRFMLDRDRHRFIFFRGMLRTILAHLLGCAAEELHFHYTTLASHSLRSPTS